MSDGVPAVTRAKARGGRAAVHENSSEAVGSAGFENVKALLFAVVNELRAIGRRHLPGARRGFTAHVGFVADLNTVSEQCPGPRLEGYLAEFRFGRQEWIGG